jgi:hypothetical protein
MLPARVSQDSHRVALAPTRRPLARGKVLAAAKLTVRAAIVMAGVASAGLGRAAEVPVGAEDLSANSHPTKTFSTSCTLGLRRNPPAPAESKHERWHTTTSGLCQGRWIAACELREERIHYSGAIGSCYLMPRVPRNDAFCGGGA